MDKSYNARTQQMKKMPRSICLCASHSSPFCSLSYSLLCDTGFIRSEWSLSVHKATDPSIQLTEEKQSHVGEPKMFSPHNKYESPRSISLKIKIHQRHRSNDGSLSNPSRFHCYNQSLLSLKICLVFPPPPSSPIPPLIFNHHVFLTFVSLSPHLLSLISLFLQFGGTFPPVQFTSRPEQADLRSIFGKRGDIQPLSSLSSLLTTFFGGGLTSVKSSPGVLSSPLCVKVNTPPRTESEGSWPQ